MRKKKDLSGERFGRVVVLSEDLTKSHTVKIYWNCLCDCGEYVSIRGDQIKKGFPSCGCYRHSTTHGMTSTPLYRVWDSMKGRCLNKNHKAYPSYGGRGITVCDRWLSFENFYEDVFPTYKAGLELDRTDNNRGYSPDNFRWVTRSQNAMNTRGRCDRKSKYKGVSYTKQGKWVASIQKEGAFKYIGSFKTEEEAGFAYNVAAKELFGEYAALDTRDWCK